MNQRNHNSHSGSGVSNSSMPLHPLSHIIICLLLSSFAFFYSKPVSLIGLLIFSWIYASLRVKGALLQTLKTLLHSLPLLFSIAVIQVLFRRSGVVYWRFGLIQITDSGVLLALQMSVRLLCVIYCAKAMAVLSFQEFQQAFAKLHLPEEIAFMLSYAIHLIPELIKRLKGFVTGLKLRGINPSKLSYGKRLRVYKLLAISALAGVLHSSKTSAIALELRGFRSYGKRSSLYNSSLSSMDFLTILFSLGLLALLAWLGSV